MKKHRRFADKKIGFLSILEPLVLRARTAKGIDGKINSVANAKGIF